MILDCNGVSFVHDLAIMRHRVSRGRFAIVLTNGQIDDATQIVDLSAGGPACFHGRHITGNEQVSGGGAVVVITMRECPDGKQTGQQQKYESTDLHCPSRTNVSPNH